MQCLETWCEFTLIYESTVQFTWRVQEGSTGFQVVYRVVGISIYPMNIIHRRLPNAILNDWQRAQKENADLKTRGPPMLAIVNDSYSGGNDLAEQSLNTVTGKIHCSSRSLEQQCPPCTCNLSRRILSTWSNLLAEIGSCLSSSPREMDFLRYLIIKGIENEENRGDTKINRNTKIVT